MIGNAFKEKWLPFGRNIFTGRIVGKPTDKNFILGGRL